jgi:hypothetical protein
MLQTGDRKNAGGRRKDESAPGQTYKHARVIGVHVVSDGKVRSADVEYKIPGESKFPVTTRPIHKLILVVPVEEQTVEEPGDLVEDKEEEADVEEGLNSSDTEGRLEGERPALEGPPLVGLDPEDTPGGENVGEAFGKEKNPEEQGRGEKEPAGIRPALKGNLNIVHHEAAEEIRDINQALRKGRGWPQKVDAGGDHQKANSQVQARGVCPTQAKGVAWDLREMGSAQGKGGREGQAPQTRSEISSQLPARKEPNGAGGRRKEESGMTKRTQHAQSEHAQKAFINVIKCY